jgi:hypothetical protein
LFRWGTATPCNLLPEGDCRPPVLWPPVFSGVDWQGFCCLCDLWGPGGSRGEAPVKDEHRRRSRMRTACPPVRIETFRLSDGGCSCYRFLVNVCGARRAPAAAAGRVPPLPESPRAAAPCRPKAGPRGCPPPLGLAAPRRRGGSLPSLASRGGPAPPSSVPAPPSPDVRRVLSRRSPGLSVRRRVDPVPPEHGACLPRFSWWDP